ncbi:hypothetical protein ERD95_15395 [Enterobacteriaceae bacterium ML5]|nr:hypothetical protein ERD95_15395 [Enterobacteriaceae bacterium ML5]
MNRLFSDAFNLLIERYNYSVNSGQTHELMARRTLTHGLKDAVSLAYNCEDIGSAMVLQSHLKLLKEQDVIPKPM